MNQNSLFSQLRKEKTGRRQIHNVSTFTPQQLQFWVSPSKQKFFVGGVGAGKTRAGVIEIMNQPKGTLTIVVAPTFTILKDSTFRMFEELYGQSGLIMSHNKTDMETKVKGDRTILWRSADKPDRLRGTNAGAVYMDEASFCDEDTYKVLLGRLRKNPGKLWATFTPRGKNRWEYRAINSGIAEMIHAPSYSNTFNPDFFVQSLKAAYDGAFYKQEVEGLFCDTDGALMKSSWIRPWQGPIPERLIMCRSWDCAATVGRRSDYTVGTLMGLIPGTEKVIIFDQIRQQYSAEDVDPKISQTSDEDGPGTTIVIEVEPGSAGKRLLQHQLKNLAGRRVAWSSPGSNKLTRAVPFSRAASAGNIFYVLGNWTDACFEEIDSFTGTPADVHDDCVDSISLGYTHLCGNMRRVIAV
jgi:predicted phage terminase large subunit-like protein